MENIGFRIKVGKNIVRKVFLSRIRARDWGLWNYKGANNFTIIPIKSKKPLCKCHIGNNKTQEMIWNCSTHGNCWNGIRNI